MPDRAPVSPARAWYDVIESPVGPLFVGGSAAGVHRVEFLDRAEDEERHAVRLSADAGLPARRDVEAAAPAVAQVREYFAGARTTFDLPLAPRGTAFQRQVWEALRPIPYGATTSYGTIAAALGRPTASRAVGAANGQNPIAIVVPCHRVVGSTGALTGYGGGMERKRWLLDHEAAQAAARPHARVA